MKFGCQECMYFSTVVAWRKQTALSVCGVEDVNMAGDPTTWEGRSDNYFYICPKCGSQVHGGELLLGVELLPGVEDEAVSVHPDNMKEQDITVTLSIHLTVLKHYSRAEIMDTLHNILIENVAPDVPIDTVFDSINIEGLDF